ncbi:MAG: hypothetical protein Q9208_006559 [Pyrenodesmia sp. 3 TL-2023]
MIPPARSEAILDRRLKRDAAPTAPKEPLILCAPGTETFIKLTREPPSDNSNDEKAMRTSEISSLVGNAWSWINREHLPPKGTDGVINKGEGWIVQRTSPSGTYKLQVTNAHHVVPVPRWGGGGRMKIVGNEVTWGVLRAALAALGQYMVAYGWTICEFEIWDGRNQVGTARIVSLT